MIKYCASLMVQSAGTFRRRIFHSDSVPNSWVLRMAQQGGNLIVAAAHQPNYLPWLGFFDKIRRSDVFIVLDDVQFPRGQGAGNWTNRSLVNVSGFARWISIPVTRHVGTQAVRDVRMAEQTWRVVHRRTLEFNYRAAPYFDDARALLDQIYSIDEETLSAFNVRVISLLLDHLGSSDRSKLVLSSTLEIQSDRTDRLVDLVKAVNADTYLTGDGADGYLEPDKFVAADLRLMRQGFVEAPRPQLRTREFVPGLSILDALFMLGVKGTNACLG